jgi:hypothetical protein
MKGLPQLALTRLILRNFPHFDWHYTLLIPRSPSIVVKSALSALKNWKRCTFMLLIYAILQTGLPGIVLICRVGWCGSVVSWWGSGDINATLEIALFQILGEKKITTYFNEFYGQFK